jgi:hypothetical protein
MIRSITTFLLVPAVGLSFAAGIASAKPRGKAAEPAVELNAEGEKHLARYQAMLDAAKAEVSAALPNVDAGLQAELDKAHAAVVQAKAVAATAQENLGAIGRGKALVGHAKGKWIGGALEGGRQGQGSSPKRQDRSRARRGAKGARQLGEKPRGGRRRLERTPGATR